MLVRPIKRLYRLCNAQHTDRVLSYGAPRKSRSEDRTFSLTEVSAHGPIICCIKSAARKYRSDFKSEQKSAHTNRFSICGNVYDRLDYETHATDRLKLCVIYKYGNITYKAR